MDQIAYHTKPSLHKILERGREVIKIEADALGLLCASLDQNFLQACQIINGGSHQLVVTGMGKSGHIGRKVAATFAATGTPAIFIHPSEAAHGDLGMLSQGDVLLVLSNSGNTSELRAILHYAHKSGIPIIGVTSCRNSQVDELADVTLLLPKVREACSVNVAPTTSTTLQLALGDALAMAIMDMRGVSKNWLRAVHPAGSIGLALSPLAEIMHGKDRLPLVRGSASMPEVISVMTRGCFGLAGVVNDTNALIGIITDGDLRRRFGVLTTAFAHEVMTPSPKVLPAEMPAGEALMFMNDNQITAAFVVEDTSITAPHPLGIIHIHDLLRIGLN